MKQIKFMVNNIIHFICYEKTQTFVLIMGQMITVVVLLFTVGIYKMMLFDKEEDVTQYTDDKCYYMYLRNSDVSITPKECLEHTKELEEWLGDDFVSVDMFAWNNSDENTYLNTYYTHVAVDEGYVERLDDIDMDEIQSDKTIIYVPKEWKLNEGDKCTVGNKEYTVVGETETWCPIIPNQAFPDGYELTGLSMYVGGMMTVERNQQIVDRLKEYFGADVEMQSPREEDLIEEQADNSIYAVIVIASVVVLLNICICYVYVVWDSRKKIMVLRLLGCSDIKVFMTYFMEFAIGVIISGGAGLLLFRKAAYPFMLKYNNYYADIYDAGTYEFTMVTFAVINIILITAVMIKGIRKGILEK